MELTGYFRTCIATAAQYYGVCNPSALPNWWKNVEVGLLAAQRLALLSLYIPPFKLSSVIPLFGGALASLVDPKISTTVLHVACLVHSFALLYFGFKAAGIIGLCGAVIPFLPPSYRRTIAPVMTAASIAALPLTPLLSLPLAALYVAAIIRRLKPSLPVHHGLDDYCKMTYKGGDLKGYLERVAGYVARGKQLAPQVIAGTALQPTKEAIRDLIWYMMSMASEKAFTRGVFRFSDPEGHFFKFLEKVDGCYARISSHFRAYKGQPSHSRISTKDHRNQRGLEMGKLELPGNMHALLFSHIDADHSTWIKPERYGLPPFYEKGHRSVTNFFKVLMHSKDYVVYKVTGGCATDMNIPTRRELFGEDVRGDFERALRIIKSAYDAQKLVDSRTEEKRLHKLKREGLRFGLSTMIEILEEEIDDLERLNLQVTLELRDIYSRFETKTAGNRSIKQRGGEVLLTSLGS